MRKKAILALGALVVLALGVSAGTFALFSAQTANTESDFTAGTLQIDSYRDQNDTVPGPLFYTTPLEGQTPGGTPGLKPTGVWAPGDTNMRVLMIRNTGSLDAWLTGVRAAMHPGSSRYLADELQVKVTTDAAGSNVLAQGTMGQFINNDQMFATKIPKPATTSLVKPPTPLYFWVSLPLNADNSYQGLSLYIDFTVYATQKKNNP